MVIYLKVGFISLGICEFHAEEVLGSVEEGRFTEDVHAGSQCIETQSLRGRSGRGDCAGGDGPVR